MLSDGVAFLNARTCTERLDLDLTGESQIVVTPDELRYIKISLNTALPQ